MMNGDSLRHGEIPIGKLEAVADFEQVVGELLVKASERGWAWRCWSSPMTSAWWQAWRTGWLS
jgi:hypothetical protein